MTVVRMWSGEVSDEVLRVGGDPHRTYDRKLAAQRIRHYRRNPHMIRNGVTASMLVDLVESDPGSNTAELQYEATRRGVSAEAARRALYRLKDRGVLRNVLVPNPLNVRTYRAEWYVT